MRLMLKPRPLLHSKISRLTFCQPRPQRSTDAAPPVTHAAWNHVFPIWPGLEVQGKEPQRMEDDANADDEDDATAVGGQLGQPPHASVSLDELMKMLSACRGLASLNQVITDHGPCFGHQQVSAAMIAVVKLKGKSQLAMAQGMLQALSVLALRELDNMDAHSLSSVLWAVGEVGGPVDPALGHGILLRTKEELASFNAHDISDVMWAMAKLRVPANDLIHELLDAATRELSQFTPRELANCLRALAAMGLDGPTLDGPFLIGWLDCAILKLPDFSAQELSDTLVALARLRIKDELFMTTWLGAATQKLPDFNTQELSSTFWAVATLDVEDEAFTAAWLSVATPKLPGFNAQELSISLWAASKLLIFDKAFIATWLSVATPKLPEFNNQELSQTLLAAASLLIEDKDFTSTWLSVATPKLPHFTAQELAKTVLAAQGFDDDEAFRQHIPNWNFQDLSTTFSQAYVPFALEDEAFTAA